MMMMRSVMVTTLMATLASTITKFERRRQAGAGGDLLTSHCIQRAACMRQGDNMMGCV